MNENIDENELTKPWKEGQQFMIYNNLDFSMYCVYEYDGTERKIRIPGYKTSYTPTQLTCFGWTVLPPLYAREEL